MKKIFTLIVICGLWTSAYAQESMEKVMEKRAKEMHRMIGLTDKEQWKKFIKENYAQTLIDKPMRAEQNTNDGTSSSSSSKALDNLEAKAGMFQQLHNDFNGSKIISLKPNGNSMVMVVRNEEGVSGTFTLKFDKSQPYLIDGLGIEISAGD